MRSLRESLIPSFCKSTTEEYAPLSDLVVPHRLTTGEEKPRHKWRDGHYFGMVCCTIIAGTVMLINIIFLFVGSTRGNVSKGRTILQDGDCSETKRLNLSLHLLINISSTLLLGASNYSMQRVSAPTRQDIDKAHRHKIWMDIGIPSIRNVFRISWPRKILWCCLLLSSVPLHFLYNSVVTSSLFITEYEVFTVANDFLAGAPYSGANLYPGSKLSASAVHYVETRLEQLRNSSTLIRLEKDACKAAYNGNQPSSSGDLLLVSKHNSTKNNSLLAILQGGGLLRPRPNCRIVPDCNNSALTPDWAITHGRLDPQSSVDHCLVSQVQQHCKTYFNLSLMIAVVACNVIKVICMAIIVLKMDHRPLATIGDAVMSFLDSPDPCTVGMCLAGKADFKRKVHWAIGSSPPPFKPRKHRRFTAASRKRWLLTTLPFGIIFVFALGMSSTFYKAFDHIKGHLMLDLPLPIGLPSDLSSILVANSPQFLLSVFYLACNSLWTSMLLADEWATYAKTRKPLRVTAPKGQQRSTYRLQLPYRFGIPFLVVFTALHWFFSQSIYSTETDSYFGDGTPNLENVDSTYNASFFFIIISAVTGITLLLFTCGLGFKLYDTKGIPFVGSCSAAMSAACHPPLGDDEASGKAVMWGVCGSDIDGDWERTSVAEDWKDFPGSSGDGGKEFHLRLLNGNEGVKVGHCSFTSFTVEDPIEGRLYA